MKTANRITPMQRLERHNFRQRVTINFLIALTLWLFSLLLASCSKTKNTACYTCTHDTAFFHYVGEVHPLKETIGSSDICDMSAGDAYAYEQKETKTAYNIPDTLVYAITVKCK